MLDRLRSRAEAGRGKAKEAAGRAAGDGRTETRGRRQQVRADLKNAGQQAKGAGRKIKDAFGH
jgi:uncharacterized protein YjbJ (UPF0337 family)